MHMLVKAHVEDEWITPQVKLALLDIFGVGPCKTTEI